MPPLNEQEIATLRATGRKLAVLVAYVKRTGCAECAALPFIRDRFNDLQQAGLVEQSSAIFAR